MTAKKRPRIPGHVSMRGYVEIIEREGQSAVNDWLAGQIGNLRDDRDDLYLQLSLLKRRLTRLEKALTKK